MRMLILLIALAIIGLIIAQQLAGPAEKPAAPTDSPATAPEVPTRPQELRGFERDINRFVQESAQTRRETIDEEAR